MDFASIPAGTTDAQALALRGADHDITVATSGTFNTTLGDALKARPGLVAAERVLSYSSVAGAMCGYFYTRDTALLHSHVHTNGSAVVYPEGNF